MCEKGKQISVAACMQLCRQRLTASGMEAAEADSVSRFLLCDHLHVSSGVLPLHLQELVEPDALLPALRRLEQGEPLQYVIGSTEFMGLPFLCSPDALIPRGDSEPLVEAALRYLQDRPSLHIADLCCGSGTFGLALLHFLPQAQAVCCDISQPALALARENARALGLSHRVRFAVGDLTAPLAQFDYRYQLIVCNPPYVPSEDVASLPVQVQAEPVLALDGGADGLTFYRRLAKECLPYLAPDGLLLLEYGEDQFAPVLQLFMQQGWRMVERVYDYGHRDRGMVLAPAKG